MKSIKLRNLSLLCLLFMLGSWQMGTSNIHLKEAKTPTGGEIVIVIEEILVAQEHDFLLESYRPESNNCLSLSPSTFHTNLDVGVCTGTEVFSIVFSDSEGTVWLESSVGSLPASFEVEDVPDGEFLVEVTTSEGYLSDWALKQTP